MGEDWAGAPHRRPGAARQGGRRARGPRRRTVGAAVVSAVLVGGCVADGAYVVAKTRVQPVVVSGPPSYAGHAAGGAGGPADRSGSVDGDLATVLGRLDTDGAQVSVAVLDMTTGSSGVYGDGAFDASGAVKADIAAAVLLRAQDGRQALADRQRGYLTAMLQRGDNAAVAALWQTVGGAAGLDAANARLGLTRTRAGADGQWGLTRTTARDQMALLRAVFADNSVLDPATQEYLQDLLGDAPEDQGWGVSAAADRPPDSVVKNGSAQLSSSRLWDVDSIGRIECGGHTVLVAVLSSGSSSRSEGVALVDSAAQAAVQAVLTG